MRCIYYWSYTPCVNYPLPRGSKSQFGWVQTLFWYLFATSYQTHSLTLRCFDVSDCVSYIDTLACRRHWENLICNTIANRRHRRFQEKIHVSRRTKNFRREIKVARRRRENLYNPPQKTWIISPSSTICHKSILDELHIFLWSTKLM